MSRGLWKERLKLEISLLVTEPASLSLEGDRVRIRYGRKMEIKQLPTTIVTDFLNWPTEPHDILRFTKLYAPIWPAETKESSERRFREIGLPAPEPGSEAEFLLSTWRRLQSNAQNGWDRVARAKDPKPTMALPPGALLFDRLNDRVDLAISDFWLFIQCRMWALPPERMKTCKRPADQGCDTPYFIATHLRQDYCSDKCAHWGLKGAKREWWRQHQEESKGGKH